VSGVSSSVVRWNGVDRTTTFVSATQLTAAIPAADIAAAGSAPVTVQNPGGAVSNALTFTITDASTPTLTTLSPSSAVAGGPGFTLTVNGSNFVSGVSGVRWNGEDRTTTFVSATQLTAAITAGDIAAPGTASVTVQNPGGASNALPFTITAPPPSPALLTGLVAYWNLDEASGTTRVGSVGFNLSDVNTVGSTTGKVGNAADFETSQDAHLGATDAAASVVDFSGNQDFTIAFWARFESQPGTMFIINKYRSDVAQRSYRIDYLASADDFLFTVSGNGMAFTDIATTANVGLATWYFVVAWHDASADTINISINDGTANSTAHTTGVFNSNANFVIGARHDNTTTQTFDGLVDELGIWNRVLTPAERTQLYNSGNGVTYPTFALVWDSNRNRWIAMNTTNDRIVYQRFLPQRSFTHAF
jgi:hypothetical protein